MMENETKSTNNSLGNNKIRLSLGARFFLKLFFFWAPKLPGLFDKLRSVIAPIALWYYPSMQEAILSNAKNIFSDNKTKKELKKFTHAVVANHYQFVVDIARGQSSDWWLRQVECIEGKKEYEQLRQQQKLLKENDFGRGAILLTLHMGAFEAGLAALKEVEKNVHVVFQRDDFAGFEKARRKMRNQLNINELPIDDGLDSLLKIRQALRDNHVVVMQGDRAIGEQKSKIMPFLNGYIRLPLGPLLLARAVECPIVPVCVSRNNNGLFTIHLGEAIKPKNIHDEDNDEDFVALSKAIEGYVKAYPKQWLVLNNVFENII